MSQKDKISYKLMSEQDIEGVAKIEKECFSVPWSQQAFIDEMKVEGSVSIVAKCGDTVCGFINGRLAVDEFYMNNIAVTEDFRRQSIADKLLFALEVTLGESAKLITLEVRASNTIAQNLYAKNGYEKVGTRKNFYEKPTEDAVLMTKTLLSIEEFENSNL